MTDILGLGYVGVCARAPDEWRAFGERLLGLQARPLADGVLGLRMDDTPYRFAVRGGDGDGVDFYGWEVAGADGLARLAARLQDAGHSVAPFSSRERDERMVADGVSVLDPGGARVELFHGRASGLAPFAPGRPISGFRTGALGMGHAVLNVPDIDAVLPFYRDLLGFRLSDYTLRPFKAFFFHTNRRHHSLALIQNERAGVHHIMIELLGLDDVGQGYDLAQLEGRVAATLGRHSNDHMTSFYLRTPSRFLIEYGWAGRDIDPETWTPVELQHGPSLWGHDRDWLSDEMKAEARNLRLNAAAQGQRAPLRVLSAGQAPAS